ncbi:MAG: DUF2806 domain-containing protein [Verrucomicrobia bacterium]|nr:DUF2806 domain-containing protein [Verrucomicrobiota bacterium]
MEIKDLAGLSEPATKLVELIGKGTGVLYEPTRIRREAKAQADALLVKTGAELEADDLRRRAAQRLVAQETKKQENLEAVLDQALRLVSSDRKPSGDVDADWINRFVLEAQEVSDQRLHAVWAKLLAGEFSSPGRFPRRLFRVLKDLEPRQAEMIDAIAAKVLRVEHHDGSSSAFLHSHIRQEWRLGHEQEQEVLAEEPLAEASLLKELGLIEPNDFIFEFSVEGPVNPSGLHLSRYSARRIAAGADQIIPAHVQPNFLRTKGAPFVNGTPVINKWTKLVTFDAWKVTSLGESLFALTGRTPDASYLTQIREHLRRAGMVFEDATPTATSATR